MTIRSFVAMTLALGAGLVAAGRGKETAAAPQEAAGKSARSPFDMPLEGYGAEAGGDGKPVVWVTTPAAGGPGSLSEALSSGDRHVRFKIAGTFTGAYTLVYPNVSIDGRDAPPPGVTFKGAESTVFVVKSRNIAFRNLRFRDMKKDGIQIDHGSQDVLVDHCSFSNSGDGCVDITDWKNTGVRNVTVSWCIVGPTHKAMLISTVKSVSVHHNLFYQNINRSPNFNTGSGGDVRNNLVYNWKLYGTRVEEGCEGNVVGNYFIPGKQSRQASDALVARGRVFAEVNEGAPDVNKGTLGQPLPAPKVTTQSASEAAKLVLEYAGAFPRDEIDAASVKEARARLEAALKAEKK